MPVIENDMYVHSARKLDDRTSVQSRIIASRVRPQQRARETRFALIREKRRDTIGHFAGTMETETQRN